MSTARPSVLASALSAAGGAFAGLMLFAVTSPDVTSPIGIIFMGGLGSILGVTFLPRVLARWIG